MLGKLCFWKNKFILVPAYVICMTVYYYRTRTKNNFFLKNHTKNNSQQLNDKFIRRQPLIPSGNRRCVPVGCDPRADPPPPRSSRFVPCRLFRPSSLAWPTNTFREKVSISWSRVSSGPDGQFAIPRERRIMFGYPSCFQERSSPLVIQ